MSKEIEILVMRAEIAINNTLNVPALGSALGKFGYNKEKLQVGKNKLDTASKAVQQQKKEYGEQYEAKNQLEVKKFNANSTYIMHLKIARIVFENNIAAIEALQLSGRRKQSLSGYIAQAQLFYSNLLQNKAWTKAMGEFNLIPQLLKEGQNEINSLSIVSADYQKETGEAQEATEIRDKAVDELADWYSNFIKIARLAVKDNPQLLEMLDIVARSN